MTVARIPHMGALMTADCRPKKPLIVLLGSAGDWQPRAMRELHAAYGSMLRTDVAVRGVNCGTLDAKALVPTQYLDVLLTVLGDADVVMIWLDEGPCWLGPELGMMLIMEGLTAVVGASQAAPFELAGHLRYLMTRANRPVHDTLDATIAAARIAAAGRR